MFNIYLERGEWWLLSMLVVATIALLLQYLLRLRHFQLVSKYVSWQAETQAVEQATQEALISGLDKSKIFVSLIVPLNEHNASQAESLVDLLFAQETDIPFEVILAEEDLSDEVKDVYHRRKKVYAQIRYTFVPDTSRYIERRKLAITLGIKASRGEWSIILNPETHPIDNRWLYHYMQNLTDDINFVEAYYNYENDGSRLSRRVIFDSVTDWVKRLNAYEKGCVLGCNTSNWAVRNSWFIAQNGFADSLNIVLGEEAIFSNRHATSDQTLLLCSPSTKLEEKIPSSKEMLIRSLFKSEAKQHFAKGSNQYYRQESFATVLVYLFCFFILSYIVGRLTTIVNAPTYQVQWLYADVVAILLIVIGAVLPWCFIRRSLRMLNERKYGAYIFIYYLLRPFRSFSIEWERWLHKQEFTRKYI